MLPRPPQPGYDQRFAPGRPGDRPRQNGPSGPNGPGGYLGPSGPGGQGGYAAPGAPGGYAGPSGPGGPAGAGGVRRRITDGFARLGAYTPVAGFARARRSREPGEWDGDAGFRSDENADQWRADTQWPPDAAARPARGPGASSPSKSRNRALVAGAGVLCVAAIAGVILAPRVFGPSDPGCKAYAGPALTAYNKMIYDLNAQAPQARLSADMAAAVSELTKATADAHGPAVKSALNALLSELKAVKADVAAGTVPTSTINALNTDSTTADKAC